ncbi:hypothetical protein [Mesorhizobium sp. A556]
MVRPTDASQRGDSGTRKKKAAVSAEHGEFAGKEAQTDVVFDWEGRTYVKPAIPIGGTSEFFGGRRPRRNRVDFDKVKHTALTIPKLSQVEHRRVRAALPNEPRLELGGLERPYGRGNAIQHG